MTYQVRITPFANNAGEKFSPEVRKAAKLALKELAKNPYHGKELQSDLSGFWSYKFLRYRIIFKIDTQEKAIIVWAIGHRRDIYDNLGDHFLNFSQDEFK
jgi:mRNA interferase RelE/StbE